MLFRWFCNLYLLCDRSQRLGEFDKYSLWKIYLNPSLHPTFPVVFLIDKRDVHKTIWKVPTHIYTLKKALHWRDGNFKSNLQRAYDLFLPSRYKIP